MSTSATRSRLRSPALAVFLLALVPRLALWAVAAGAGEARLVEHDTGSYLQAARTLLGTYLRGSDVSLTRPPGYPTFLAITAVGGSHLAVAAFLQCIVSASTAAGVYLLARAILRDSKAALVAGLVMVVDVVSIGYAVVLMSESVFTALLVWAMVVAMRAERIGRGVLPWVAVGTMLGLAALVRPVGLYLVPLLAILLGARSRSVSRGFLVLALATLLPGAWIVRNVVAADLPSVSAIEGHNFFDFRAAGAIAERDNISLEEARARLAPRYVAAVADPDDLAEESRVKTRLGIQIITQEAPGGYAESAVRSMKRMILGPGYPVINQLVGSSSPYVVDAPSERVVALVSWLLLVLTYCAVLLGAVRLLRERAWMLLGTITLAPAYLLIVSAGPEGYSRFRVPIVPFLALLAGAATLSAGRRPADESGSDQPRS